MPPKRFRSGSSRSRGGGRALPSSPPAAAGDTMVDGTAAFFSGITGAKPSRPAPVDALPVSASLPGETVLAGSSAGAGQQTQDQVMWIELGLCKALVRAVTHAGFLAPTPVQAKAIPAILTGSDVCARAVTGSGKTAAFLLPMLHLLLTRPPRRQSAVGGKRRYVRAVVLVPTRELGTQCQHMLHQLMLFSSDLTVALAIGGVAQSAQEAALDAVPDIIIATPGRLVDLLHNYKGSSGPMDFSGLEVVILDECDKMLTVTLRHQVVDILKRVPEETRQLLMFSATMTADVDAFATEYLFEPKNVDIGHVALQSNLRQQFVRIRASSSTPPAASAAPTTTEVTERGKAKRLRSKRLRSTSPPAAEAATSPEEHVTRVKTRYLVALCEHYFRDRTMIFTRYRTTAHRLHLLFTALGLESAELHGSQLQAERFAALERFAAGTARYLFSTDVASRGLDIRGVSTVINVDMPPTLTAYVHRVGRTARIGASGTAVSLVDEAADAAVVRHVLAVSGAANAHQRATVRRRDVPEALLAAAAQRVDAAVPAIRAHMAADALAERIARAERQLGGDAALAESAVAAPQRAWCIGAAERRRRDAAAREAHEKEAEDTVRHFQSALAGWSREEKAFLAQQRRSRREARERTGRAKERTKSLERENRRKAEQKVRAGAVKKLKKRKIRDARKARRAESREKNGKTPYKHGNGKKGLKKSRHRNRPSRH